MSLSDNTYDEIRPVGWLNYREQAAWELYCEETAGDMDVRDFWWDLPAKVRELYLDKIDRRARG
jgi:hypothetical protein